MLILLNAQSVKADTNLPQSFNAIRLYALTIVTCASMIQSVKFAKVATFWTKIIMSACWIALLPNLSERRSALIVFTRAWSALMNSLVCRVLVH